MPAAHLFQVPLWLTVVMLLAMFISVVLTMLVLSRLLPQLTSDAHESSQWLDGLRGMAAAIVSLNHAPLVIMNLQVAPKVFVFTRQEFSLFQFFGSLGVQVFFCITGMLFAHKIFYSREIDWTEFYRKRMNRIVPAYLFACTLAVLIAAWYSWPISQQFSEIFAELPRVFLFGLMPVPTINGFHFSRLLGIVWTLAYEWRFYAILPFAWIIIRRGRTTAVVTVVIIAIFAIADSMLTLASWWVFFVSGALCAPLLKHQFDDRIRMAGSCGIFFILTIYALFWERLPNYGSAQWILTSLFFACVAVARPRILRSNPMVAMGSVSYSFYLLHCLVLFAVFEGCRRYAFDVTEMPLRYFTMLAGCVLALAAIISALSYIFVERPFMRTPRTDSRANGAGSIPVLRSTTSSA